MTVKNLIDILSRIDSANKIVIYDGLQPLYIGEIELFGNIIRLHVSTNELSPEIEAYKFGLTQTRCIGHKCGLLDAYLTSDGVIYRCLGQKNAPRVLPGETECPYGFKQNTEEE